MATRMEELLAIVTANSEEAVDDFLVLTQPETHEKAEIEEVFEEVLGYNPVTYYDYDTLKVMLDNMLNSDELPKDVIKSIESDKDAVIKEAFEKFDSERNIYLQDALNYAIEEKTGFNPGVVEDEDEDVDDETDIDDFDSDFDEED